MSVASSLPRARPGLVGRLAGFTKSVFEPKLHAAFAGFWSISLYGNLHVVSDVPTWRWDRAVAVLAASVFATALFLRIVDEIKDYEYDVVHNPGRPLVTGAVSRSDLVRYLVVVAAILLVANALVAVPLAIWLALDMGYGLFHLPLERWCKPVRDNLLVNLVAIYPVNIALSVYTVLVFLERTGVGFQSRQAWLVVAYACAFLHFEFARKSGWPHLAEPSERLYSQILGLRGALFLSTGFGVAALGTAVWLFAPWTRTGAGVVTGWLPLLGLAPMSIGLWLYARNRDRRHAARPPAVAFLFAFYLTMFVNAVATRQAAWGG